MQGPSKFPRYEIVVFINIVSVKLFHDQKYGIVTSELYHPVTSFNGKIYLKHVINIFQKM